MRKRCRKRLQAVAKKAAEKVFYFLSRPLIIEDSVLFMSLYFYPSVLKESLSEFF